MIALMWQSCNGERAASHINNMKTKERTGLIGDGTFEAIVFNTCNMPELHDIYSMPLFLKRITKGRKTGVFKDSDGDSASDEPTSKAVRRHLKGGERCFVQVKNTSQLCDVRSKYLGSTFF